MSMNPFFEDIVIEMSGTGPTGKTGNSIANIEKTSSSGLVDTYTITMTWGQTYEFTVENGNGIESITKTSTDVLTDTYTIQYTNGTSTTFEVVNGNGIANIAKTSTDVLSDTYTITYTNGTTTTYTVTNGKGIIGITKTGTAGLVDTYTITYNDGTTSTYTVTNGEKGDTGNGIESITKTGTAGLVDTYTILYTNGQTTTYTVTNGNGISGISKIGTSGLTDTYTISFTNGTSTTFQVVNGNGIASIEKTATVGAVDTYTITYTDGTTTTFDVTNGSDEWGAIVGTLSDQTDLQNALDAKAPAIEESASGSIVTISDGADSLPVSALSVGIEPVQDLHGYDNPWPAGGGSNRLNTATVPDENKYISKTNGTPASPSSGTAIWRYTDYIPVTPGEELFFGEIGTIATLAGSAFYDSNKDFVSGFTATELGNASNVWTVPSGVAYLRHSFRIDEGYNTDWENSVYIILNSSTHAWSPYSNICPISGHSTATVTRTGKNLLWCANGTYAIGTTRELIISDNVWSFKVKTAAGSSAFLPEATVTAMNLNPLPAGTYTFSLDTNAFASNKLSLIRLNLSDGQTIANGSSFTLTQKTSIISITSSETIDYSTTGTYNCFIQIESGSTATAYEAPSIQTVTIDLDGTRYGGVIDVLTGEMTVTKVSGKLGTSSWVKSTSYPGSFYHSRNGVSLSGVSYDLKSNTPFICSHAKTVTSTSNYLMGTCFCDGSINIRIMPEGSEVSDWQTYLTNNDVYICAELATPVTVQLTPAQLETLKGQNAIWSSTGSTNVTYRADSKMYIDQQIASANRATRSMITAVTDIMVAPSNLVTGDLVIVGDTLYKAISNIASGSTLTVGTNVQSITLAQYIIDNLA